MEGQESEEDALDVREGILALLECSEPSFDTETGTSIDNRKEHHCRSLIRSLQSLKASKAKRSTSGNASSQGQFIRTNISDYNNKSARDADASSVSIREVLGNLPSSATTKLAPLLSSFLTDRVDAAELLPATQDEGANEEAMGKAAITLTSLSLVAAQLYVELIGMPGAWGAGMIDVGAISSLAALVKRWCLECRGREPREDKKPDEDDGSKRKSAKTKRAPPVKRSRKKNARRSVTAVIDSDSEDSIELSEDDNEEKKEDIFPGDNDQLDDSPLSTGELITGGLRVALSLADVLYQKEFMNWSSEAREALLDAIVTALATTSALVSGQSYKAKLDTDVVAMGKEVEARLSMSLQKWVLSETGDGNNPSQDEIKESKTKRHETSVYLLRGLLPVISMQTELPNGQRGKEAANDMAVSTLEGFIRFAVVECSQWPMEPRSDRTPRTTPMSTRRRDSNAKSKQATNSAISTPLTSRKDRKKRVSFGNVNDEGVVPPTLKKTVTPRRSRSRSSLGNDTPTQNDGKPRPILSAVIGLFQKLITAKGLERANVRARMIEALYRCLPLLPLPERSHFLGFAIKLCHSKLSIHRLLGAEIIGLVLSEKWLWRDHGSPRTPKPRVLWTASKTPASRRESISPMMDSSLENLPSALFNAIHGRLTDKVPAVRARSAFSLADVFQKFSGGEVGIKSGDEAWAAFEQVFTGISSEMLVCLRKRAARDERATVKKAAISALVELLVLGETFDFEVNNRLCISESDVLILSRLCADQSVSTRKAAADALTLLLQKCYYTGHCSVEAAIMLEQAWSGAILPLVLDVETSCVARAVDLFSLIVIEPLIEVGGREVEWKDEGEKRRYLTAWRILAHASESSRQQGAARGEAGSLRAVLKKRFMETGCDERGAARSLLKEIHHVADTTLQGENDLQGTDDVLFQDDIEAQRIGVWCLLDAFVDFQSSELTFLTQIIKRSSIDMKFLATSWEAMLHLSISPTTPKHSISPLQESMRSCLKVLSKLALLVPKDDAQVSIERLKDLLGSFTLVPNLVGTAISALVALTQKTCLDPAETKKECSLWIKELYEKCQGAITLYISMSQSGDRDLIDEQEVSLVRALFTVGELSMVGFRADEDSLSRSKGSNANTLDTEERDHVTGLYEPPSKLLRGLVQTMLPKLLPASEVSLEKPSPTPEAARAHAFAVLGKFCLRDEALAKECLTILARELHHNLTDTAPSVQSNALLVLGDLCVKYTNLVDRYLPVMAACLQSGNSEVTATELTDSQVAGSALVRRHAVLLLSSLILQDYLKWRGLLFHRFLVASVDEDPGVAKLAEMTLCGPLFDRHPKLFFNNFVESLFVLNRCTAHPIYTAAAMTGDNGGGIAVGFDGINFSGPSGKARRLQMYEMMLSNMSDEEKIGITARLAKDVLGGALETDGDLSRVCRRPALTQEEKGDRETSALNVLSDAFAILTSPSLRVGKVASDDDEIKDADQPNPNQLVVAAKGRLLSKISRKHLIEIVLPILCNLKTILQESCSPLLKDLMRYLVEIFRVYKAEVREFLANDPTLLQEVEYDANQFRKAQKKGTPSRRNQSEGVSIAIQ